MQTQEEHAKINKCSVVYNNPLLFYDILLLGALIAQLHAVIVTVMTF